MYSGIVWAFRPAVRSFCGELAVTPTVELAVYASALAAGLDAASAAVEASNEAAVRSRRGVLK
jgi:hypothetical protein